MIRSPLVSFTRSMFLWRFQHDFWRSRRTLWSLSNTWSWHHDTRSQNQFDNVHSIDDSDSFFNIWIHTMWNNFILLITYIQLQWQIGSSHYYEHSRFSMYTAVNHLSQFKIQEYIIVYSNTPKKFFQLFVEMHMIIVLVSCIIIEKTIVNTFIIRFRQSLQIRVFIFIKWIRLWLKYIPHGRTFWYVKEHRYFWKITQYLWKFCDRNHIILFILIWNADMHIQ